MKPKRLISLLVAVCMMITMLPLSAVTAFAEDTSSTTGGTASYKGYNYAYTVNTDGTATITRFLGPVKPTSSLYYVDIPAELDGRRVTGIGYHAFYECIPLMEVTIPESVTSIGEEAFNICTSLDSVTIKDAATSIGDYAFCQCTNLKTVKLGKYITKIGEAAFCNCPILNNFTIPDSVTSIGRGAFEYCYALTNVTIPEKVEKIEDETFDWCWKLESITLPAGLTSFQDSLYRCSPDCVIYYNNDEAHAHDLFGDKLVGDKLAGRKFLCLCNVTFDANDGTLTDKGGNPTDHAVVSAYKTQKINADDLKAIPNPTRAGYNFTGWYTADNQPLDVNEITTKDMTKDITFYARWELAPKAPVCHPLTLKDGVITSVTVPGKNGADPEDITEIVKKNANEDGSFNVPEGATVSVAFDKDAFADSGLKFGHWDITGLDDPNAYQDKESFDFVMPAKAVTLKAMTQDASIEDDGPNVLGTAAIIGTAAVGGAVLGYQAYSLGAEFAGKLMALPYFPSNRSALAMMLWEDAGKPMPESELLYPDVEQEEQDMDLQHAARWAMENELIPDLNDEGTAPEEMKFFPANPVSKLDVLNAWQKAQELKNN